MSCIGCNQAQTQQKADDEKMIKYAAKQAKEENRSIGLYRNAEGALCIASGGEPISMLITPHMQGD